MPVADTTADSPAFWLYSSGTTGLSKGVMHAHGNMQATYDTYARTVLEVTSADRFLSVAKLFFAYGLGNSLTFPFGAGATVILHPERPTPAAIGQLVAAEAPTLFFAVPGFVAGILDADIDPAAFRSVRAGVTAGEALPADLQRRCSERFGFPVLDGIGSTEALHIFLSNRLDRQEPGSSGWVVDGYEAQAARRRRPGDHRAGPARLPPRAWSVDRDRLLVAPRGVGGDVPVRRLAADRRRVPPLRAATRGRSSAATTT